MPSMGTADLTPVGVRTKDVSSFSYENTITDDDGVTTSFTEDNALIFPECLSTLNTQEADIAQDLYQQAGDRILKRRSGVDPNA